MFSILNLQFPNFKIQNVTNFKIRISQFLNLKSKIYKIPSFQFQNLNSKFLSFKFISEFLISNISNYQLQNFNFKLVFKNFKHVINSIVPIKWVIAELICVTYKWAWVEPDISCIILTNNLTNFQLNVNSLYFVILLTLFPN